MSSRPRRICSAFMFVLMFKVFVPTIYAQKGGASPAQGQMTGPAAAQGGSTPYFETEMEAYGAVNELSRAIAEQVCKGFEKEASNKDVVIFDQASFQNVLAWQTFNATAIALKGAYETLLTDAQLNTVFPPPAPATPTTRALIPITSGSDLGTLITDLAASTTNNASTFTIQDSVMAVSLAHQFGRLNGCKVNLKYYPLFGSYVDLTSANTFVQNAFGDLNKLRQYIQVTLGYSAANPTMDYRASLLTDLNSQYDQLLKSISSNSSQGQQPNQTQGGSLSSQATGGPNAGTAGLQTSGAGVVSLMQGAALNDLLAQGDTYILYADVVAAGGTQRDRKNLITLLTGDWLSYSGGAVVNFALIRSKDTKLISADTLRYRTQLARHISGPRENPKVENTNAGENEDSICGEERRLHWWERRAGVTDPCPK